MPQLQQPSPEPMPTFGPLMDFALGNLKDWVSQHKAEYDKAVERLQSTGYKVPTPTMADLPGFGPSVAGTLGSVYPRAAQPIYDFGNIGRAFLKKLSDIPRLFDIMMEDNPTTLGRAAIPHLGGPITGPSGVPLENPTLLMSRHHLLRDPAHEVGSTGIHEIGHLLDLPPGIDPRVASPEAAAIIEKGYPRLPVNVLNELSMVPGYQIQKELAPRLYQSELLSRILEEAISPKQQSQHLLDLILPWYGVKP